jgi:hypothetical protein
MWHVWGEKTRAEFWLGIPKERDHVEHMGVSGGTSIKCKLKGMVGVDWINLALNRDKWLALMKRALKFLFHTAENFWTK